MHNARRLHFQPVLRLNAAFEKSNPRLSLTRGPKCMCRRSNAIFC